MTLIPGDGIGPEISDAAVRAIEAIGVHIEWERVEVGAGAEVKTGEFLPDAVFESLQRNRVGLKGPAGRLSALVTAAQMWPCASTSTCSSTSVQ